MYEALTLVSYRLRIHGHNYGSGVIAIKIIKIYNKKVKYFPKNT